MHEALIPLVSVWGGRQRLCWCTQSPTIWFMREHSQTKWDIPMTAGQEFPWMMRKPSDGGAKLQKMDSCPLNFILARHTLLASVE